jgi:hypothetical protein
VADLPTARQPAPNELLKQAARPRNRLLDRIFYNTSPQDEQWLDQTTGVTQGSIITVEPGSANPLRLFRDVVDFLDDEIRQRIQSVSIAGVGSSALGAIGLARDVASATKAPVAAVVSGYGMDDLLYEALGGWFRAPSPN